MNNRPFVALMCGATLILSGCAPPGSPPAATLVAPYSCTFDNGRAVETPLPCEPWMVKRFSARLVALYPAVRQINTSPDYMMGLYSFSMAGCTGHFAALTPEQIGESGEPFFPKEMLAAMITAGREIICPDSPVLSKETP